MINGARIAGLILAGICLVGCAGQKPAASPALPLSELHVLTMPVALNFDKQPGADGFILKLYGVSPKQAKTVPIRQGTLEVMMYDGTLTGSLADITPVRTWRFEPADLKSFEIDTSIGVGYNLALRWEKDLPKETRVTVVARYQPVEGPALYSARTSLAVVDINP